MLSSAADEVPAHAVANELMVSVGGLINPSGTEGYLASSLRVLASRDISKLIDIARDIISSNTREVALWRAALGHLRSRVNDFMSDEQVFSQFATMKQLVPFSARFPSDLTPDEQLAVIVRHSIRAEQSLGYDATDPDEDYNKVKAGIIVLAAKPGMDPALCINEIFFIADNLDKVVPHLSVIIDRGNVYQDFIEELMTSSTPALEQGML